MRNATKCGGELGRVEGFHNPSGRAGVLCAHLRHVRALGRENEDRTFSVERSFAQLFDQAKTVKLSHINIRQHHINFIGRKPFECFLFVLGLLRSKPGRSERSPTECMHAGAVIDSQIADGRGCCTLR